MRRVLGLTTFLCLCVAATAQATPIVINSGATLAGNASALAAFNRAATTLGSMFSDPIQVNIDADLANLGNPSIIGQSSSVILAGGYTLVRDQLASDAADEADDAIVGSLPTVGQYLAFVPAGFGLDGNIAGTKANLKAMGFAGLDGAFGANDATITFNSTFAFDFDNSNGVDGDLVDFETVALHELMHALGFVSAVDHVDFAVAHGQPDAIAPFVLDWFRFGAANTPTTAAEFTNNARSLVPNTAARTSDVINSWAMSSGVFTGDGRQASHWKDDSLTGVHIGVMDPTLSNGVSFGLTAADIRSLDLIGWDEAAVQPVPEPTSVVLLGSGLAVAAWVRRKRRRTPSGT